MRALADDLARALAVPSVRVPQDRGRIIVEVPHADARPISLLPLLSRLSNRPPATAILGVTATGDPLLLRLLSPDVAHVLIAGTTGCGKTMLLRTIVLSLALGRGEIGMILIDPRGQAFTILEGLPHLVRPILIS